MNYQKISNKLILIFLILGWLIFLNRASGQIPSKLSGKRLPNSTKVEIQDTLLLRKMMQMHPYEFGSILEDSQHLEVQIIYTQINRDRQNKPHFTRYTYHFRPKEYFYPASTVKLPLIPLALEKIHSLRSYGINKFTPMLIDSLRMKQRAEIQDTTSFNHYPSIAQYIRRILLVSDNDAYNRLFEFLGPDSINLALHQKGFRSARIIHRLEVADDSISARWMNPIQFVDGGKTRFKFPERFCGKSEPSPFHNTLKGKGYILYSGTDSTLVPHPFDFSNKNGISLMDEQEILKALVFPKLNPKPKFQLDKADYAFILKYLSMLPRESIHPYYPEKHFPDNYCKFILYGSDSAISIPPSIRIFNKIGQAYGFLIENAYVVDFDEKLEFMVSAVINCNTDGIYNDNIYAYDTIGFPFFRNLGNLIYQFEKDRIRKVVPNLAEYKINYQKSDE